MKTNLVKLSAVAAFAAAGTLIAADQGPAPSAPPSSSPTDVRNPTNPSSPANPDSAASGSSSAAAAGSSQFQGKITAVDKETKMVTIQDSTGKSQKLHIGETTKLSRGSASSDSANWDDLKVGTQISGMHKMQGSTHHAESVTISSVKDSD